LTGCRASPKKNERDRATTSENAENKLRTRQAKNRWKEKFIAKQIETYFNFVMSILRQRTKRFAVSVFDLIDQIPQTPKGLVVQTQLAKAASSAAANYRAAQRARSRAEFISKLSISLEEIDESAFWLEFLPDTRLVPSEEVESLVQEANELAAIVVASRRTARKNGKK
jgi:four helix bundle protein